MIKQKVRINIKKLYNAMLEKKEQVPATFTKFLKDLQCPNLSCGEVYVCDFLSIRNLPSDEDDYPVKLADLTQRIQEFISFYYNIYDDVIYLEMEA